MSEESPIQPGAEIGLDPAVATPPSQERVDSTGSSSASGRKAATSPRPTVAGRVWVAIGFAVIVLALLIIFIAENSHEVTISFLGANGKLSLGLAMLISALAGVVITLLVGTTRIFQLRRELRRHERRARASH